MALAAHSRERRSQHSVLLELNAQSDRMQSTLTYARNDLREPLTVHQLAEVAN
jgi:transcriptional regulator GlxA family with amidase domain